MAAPLFPNSNVLSICMATRMTRQITVPKCDGPILLLLDVSSCCAGTPSPKTPRSAGVAASWARLPCRRSIDPPAVAKSPVVAIVGLSPTRSGTYSGVFAWGHRSLLSRGCSIDSFVRLDYLRPPSPAGIRLGVINAQAALFNQDHHSTTTFTVWPAPSVGTMLTKTVTTYDKVSGLMITCSIFVSVVLLPLDVCNVPHLEI